WPMNSSPSAGAEEAPQLAMRGELRGAPGAAVVVIRAGGETASFWRLTLALTPAEGDGSGPQASCVEVCCGKPVLLDCELSAVRPPSDVNSERGALNLGGGSIDTVLRNPRPDGGVSDVALTHTLRATGPGSSPTLVGCLMKGATGSGVLLLDGASASLVQCQITGNQQGGILVADRASLLLESCEIC
ncbi:unnamed protein product, partial [Polarella glacialis]